MNKRNIILCFGPHFRGENMRTPDQNRSCVPKSSKQINRPSSYAIKSQSLAPLMTDMNQNLLATGSENPLKTFQLRDEVGAKAPS
jgi:hypothetical protein